jgi:Tfp pilus assembly protein PilF
MEVNFMTENLKLIVLICFVSALLLCGCEGNTVKTKTASARTASPEELKRIEKVTAPVEDTKAQILKQLEGRFEDPDVHYNLGKLYQRDGMWSRAEHEFSTALSFDPAHRESQAARVKVLLQSGDKGKAKILANDYISQASNSAAGSLRLAMGFQKENLDDYALTSYRQALSLAPNSAKVNKQIGYFYMSRNQRDLAKDYLIRSFQLDPTQAEVARELGILGVVVQVRTPSQAEGKKIDKANTPGK